MPVTEAYILAAARTPVGRPLGQFASVPASVLAAAVLGAVAAGDLFVEEVVLGNTVGPGGNLARVSLLEARLSASIPGITVDRQCGSGLDAVWLGARLLGEEGVVLAGGVESVSTSPMLRRLPNGIPYVARARMAPEWLGDPDMASAAEHVAVKYGISRHEQDEWACLSVARTLACGERLQWGLVPVGSATADEWRDRRLQADRLARYPALVPGGSTVTAANSAPPADGAAALLLGSERAAAFVRPLARIVAYAAAGVDPAEPGMGPVPALEAACRQAGRRPGDLDRVEINEAYAAKVLACMKALDLDPARVNPDGGAIALGHPFGATGALLLVRLLGGLAPGQWGAVTLGIGGGLGVAMIVERV